MVGLEVQGAAQNTRPFLSDGFDLPDHFLSMIEEGDISQRVSPRRSKRTSGFEQVVCLASSAPTVVRVALGEREGEGERKGSI